MTRIQMAYDLDTQELIEVTALAPVAIEVEIISPVIHWTRRNKITTEQVQAFWQAHPSVAERAFLEGVSEALESWPEWAGFSSSDRFWAAHAWTCNVMVHGDVFFGAEIYSVEQAQMRQDEQDAWAEQAAQYAEEARRD